MKRKLLLIAVALLCSVGAWATDAYQTYLTVGKGWTQVTDLTSLTLSDYYFAIVSSDNTDLMVKLDKAKSGQQDTNHSMWYMNAKDPLKDNSYLWTLEANNTSGYVGYTIRNVDRPVRVIQTHDGNPQYARTNWETTSARWTSYSFNLNDGKYTIQALANGGTNYLGLWTPSNGYVSGQELAGNKSGDDIGKFLLFAISKTTANAAIAAATDATYSAPFDLAPSLFGRTKSDYTGATEYYGDYRYIEKYNDSAAPSTGDKVTKTITTAPNGYHLITVIANAAWISGRGSVGTTTPTVNDNSTVVTVNGVSQNVPVKTDGSYDPVTLTFKTYVTDNTISFKITNNDAAAFWFVWDISDIYYGTLITNPSFETGDLTGWIDGKGQFTVSNGSDLSEKAGTYYAASNLSNNTITLDQNINFPFAGKYILQAKCKTANHNNEDNTLAASFKIGSSSVPVRYNVEETYYVAYEAASDGASALISYGGKFSNRGNFYCDNFILKYYAELPNVEDIEDIDALLAEPMGGDERYALEEANTAYTDSKTVANYNALQTAIVNAQTSIAEFAAKTGSNTDWTGVIRNPAFSNADAAGWTITGTSGNRQYGSHAAEAWNNSSNVNYSQVIKNLPAGYYKLTAQVDNGRNTDKVKLYATCDETTESATAPYLSISSYSSTATDLNGNTGLCKTELFIQVTEGKDLTIGVKDESTSEGWMIFDNFTLTRYETLPTDDEMNAMAVTGTMNSTVNTNQTTAISTYKSTKNITNLNSAAAAMAAAEHSKALYASISSADLTAYRTKMGNVLANTNVYTTEAYNKWYAEVETNFSNGVYTNEEVLTLTETGAYSSGWHSSSCIDDVLLSAWDAPGNWTGYYVNTWSTVDDSGNPNLVVPAIEYWTSDASSLSDKTMTATISDLMPNGRYHVSAFISMAKNTTAYGSDATTAPTGVTLQVGSASATTCTGTRVGSTRHFDGTFEADGTADEDGNLTIKIITTSTNASWILFRDVKYVSAEYLAEKTNADRISPSIAASVPQATVDDVNAALENLLVGEYEYVADHYGIDRTEKYSADLANWSFSGSYSNGAYIDSKQTNNGNHWSGETKTYYEQGRNAWGNPTWVTTYTKTIDDLPAGNYVLKVAGRACSASVNLTLSATFGGNTITESLPTNGGSGKGITTAGVASFDEGTFANTNGYGWQWRYLAFTLASATDVTFTIRGASSAEHQWFSVCDFALLKDEITKDELIDDLSNAISEATAARKSANEGSGVFQIPSAAGEAFGTAISDAQDVYDDDDATASDVSKAIDDLKTAEETYANVELNAPADGKKYYIKVATSGHAKENNAWLTFLSTTDANNPTGYKIQANNAPVDYLAQAYTFTQVSGNTYNISIALPEGEVYLTYGSLNGSGAGWADSQIQATTNSSNKGIFEIVATNTANVFNIVNTKTSSTIACQAGGNIYTESGNADFTVEEASQASVTVSAKAGKYGTVIFPFTPDINSGFGDITFYSCASVNGETDNVLLTEEDTPTANTPYIIKNASGSNFSTVLTGWGTANMDKYTTDLLTGVYEDDLDIAADANNYILQTQDDVQAFYLVTSTAFKSTAYKAYLTYEAPTPVKAFGFDFADAIKALEATESENVVIYNLAGQRMSKAKKGVNIINGKKVLVK